MHRADMSIKLSKERVFERTVRKYWEKLVNGILVPGERGCTPSEGEVLSVYNELKERHPECECFILRTGEKSGEFYQQGDKIGGIRIIQQLGSVGSIEFRLSGNFHVRLEIEGFMPFFRTEACCDLAQTISNFENFTDKFPSYLEEIEKKKLEFELGTGRTRTGFPAQDWRTRNLDRVCSQPQEFHHSSRGIARCTRPDRTFDQEFDIFDEYRDKEIDKRKICR